MKRSSLILLIFCNLAWTMNPLLGKILLTRYSGLQVAWIRYGGGFAAFVLAAALHILFDRRKRWSDYFLIPTSPRSRLDLLALGIGPFVYSPILQFVGLQTAQAMDNSILIATEPLLTVVYAWIVLGERMNRHHWVSMGISLVGFFLFSGLFGVAFGTSVGIPFSVGMLLLVFAQLGEGTYSVFSRKLVQKYPPTAVLGTALAIGAILLTGIVASFDRLPSPVGASSSQLVAALFIGPIGSTLTYLIWAFIARYVSVASMAITLFIQPVVGAFLGMAYLGESLTPERWAGALLILVGIAYLSWREIRRPSSF